MPKHPYDFPIREGLAHAIVEHLHAALFLGEFSI